LIQNLKTIKEKQNSYHSIPGIAETACASIIAEIGVDMSKFKTSEHILFLGRSFTKK
jgi:transposase